MPLGGGCCFCCRRHWCNYSCCCILKWVKKVKVKVEHLYSAPSIDTATSEALRYMARTKQRHTYLPYTFPAVAGTHLPTPRGWRVDRLSKPRPRVQRPTGRLLHNGPQPVGFELTTSRSLVEHANH